MDIHEEIWREMIARIVHESNRQEDLYLDIVRTRELTDAAFNEPIGIRGPHLDINTAVQDHKEAVIRLKRERKSAEEIAAYNLSQAHMATVAVAYELAFRQSASLAYPLARLQQAVKESQKPFPKNLNEQPEIIKGLEAVKELCDNTTPVPVTLSVPLETEGEVLQALLRGDHEDLLRPMKVDYIHLFHRITTMGLLHPSKCGVFRKTSVHLEGNTDVVFPVPSLVPGLMAEFVNKFPTILPPTVKYDPILKAAEVSHRFVAIHPYSDGNGRLSRLLTNLVLWLHHPPVYLKADAKGKHRYHQALKRADNGNIKPLACLIATYLKSIYKRLLASVGLPQKEPREG